MAGYAIECALKACIAKSTARFEFPDLDRVKSSYTHNLAALLRVAKLDETLDDAGKRQPPLAKKWHTVKRWSEQARYARKTESEAKTLLHAVGRQGRYPAMVRNSLVGLDIELGQQTLEILDAAYFPVKVALWILRGEDDDWHLLLATPLYDRLGPGEANGKMMDALLKTDYDWVRSPIQLTGTRTPLIRALRRDFGKTENVAGKRVFTGMLGDTWVQEAYVYRIR